VTTVTQPVVPHTRVSRRTAFFAFPDPVNEIAARCVAAGVVVMATTALVFDEHVVWLLVVLAYGFTARMLTGPTMSPLGQLATRVVVPRLPIAPRLVPGPPKRFAQAMGFGFSVSALVLTVVGEDLAARIVLALLVAAATLESVFAICLGCAVFGVLMRLGIIPAEICERCNNLSLPRPAPAAAAR
jgi:hypothetical protein